jgi:mannan endo-1,4-beta-mannosidase
MSDAGGIKWWVENVLGPGKDPHLFYTDPTVKAAYKKYIYTILTRNNTITGRLYKDDPTIFSGKVSFQ